LKALEDEINRQAEASGVPDGHQASLTEENGRIIVTDAAGTLNVEIVTSIIKPL
jgi:hypothetical protein